MKKILFFLVFSIALSNAGIAETVMPQKMEQKSGKHDAAKADKPKDRYDKHKHKHKHFKHTRKHKK